MLVLFMVVIASSMSSVTASDSEINLQRLWIGSSTDEGKICYANVKKGKKNAVSKLEKLGFNCVEDKGNDLFSSCTNPNLSQDDILQIRKDLPCYRILTYFEKSATDPDYKECGLRDPFTAIPVLEGKYGFTCTPSDGWEYPTVCIKPDFDPATFDQIANATDCTPPPPPK